MAAPPAAGLWDSLGPLRLSLGTEEAVRAAHGDGDRPEETGASGRRTHESRGLRTLVSCHSPGQDTGFSVRCPGHWGPSLPAAARGQGWWRGVLRFWVLLCGGLSQTAFRMRKPRAACTQFEKLVAILGCFL